MAIHIAIKLTKMTHPLKSTLIALAVACTLTSSCATPCGDWQNDSSRGTPASFNSTRLYLAPSSGCAGLQLEMVRTVEGIRLYLNVFGLEIPPNDYDEDRSSIFISYRDHSYTFLADRFMGGQRLLIPKNVQDDIVHYLQEGQPVFIRVGRYQADIFPNQFIKPFMRMVTVPLA